MNNESLVQNDGLVVLPSEEEIASHYLIDEAQLLKSLVERAYFTVEEKRQINSTARRLVHAARAGRRQYGGVDAFLNEYGLTTEEGIILMCLAEALLRVPDADTADSLIDDKISSGDWAGHLGHSDSLFVNASTWGLMLTGRVISLKSDDRANPLSFAKRLVAQSGEPFIRQALRHAMKILGDQFVLGRNINEALKRGEDDENKGYRFSYDMLGEAARTARDAERYYNLYMDAVEVVGKHAGPIRGDGYLALMERPGMSVKLSAIHPRFEPMKIERVRRELVPRLVTLARAAREQNLALTVDAEEADRLDLTLQIFADCLGDPALRGWHGLGIVVQAYGKRALPVLRWLKKVAKASGHRLPLRLVKGAYWDTEIKFAQEQGLADYPVFTRKSNTDVSYLACARFLLSEPDVFYPQFATHNAQTIAAVETAASGHAFEYQRLHGMAEALYSEVIEIGKLGRPCRIYAPVGGHEDLLAYLVRRLLENGANTSFVNRLADDELPVAEIIADPVERAEAHQSKSHPRIPRPPDLYEPQRRNSTGLPHWEEPVRRRLLDEIDPVLSLPLSAAALVMGDVKMNGDERAIVSPHDRSVAVGVCVDANDAEIELAVEAATHGQHAWDRLGGAKRAEILETAAQLYERDRAKLIAALVREAGKTIPNALGDVREAVDFLRYYAAQARRIFEGTNFLRGPTGERDELSLHGRGLFACISPWNFPLAIFTGQIAGSLAAGNAVLAKPAEQTPLVAFMASQLLLEAGVPANIYHLLPGSGATVGARLVNDLRVGGVAFTGSNETANLIQRGLTTRGGPIVPFIAETGGINAMIVDSSALPEQVVRDVISSAFDSAGQRCSALRVLFLQDDIADRMLTMLLGAMEELQIGDPLDYDTDIGPVIDEDAEDALNAHKLRMRQNERELIELAMPDDCRQGTYVTPAAFEIEAISVLNREVFGPILHVVRYQSSHLDKVCEAINATGYGLTLGLHSRIATTADYIGERVRVGNFYVNRNQIGAVVGVQPFGGEGLSGTGPKAGGPNYLPRFAVERVRSTDITATGGNAELLSLEQSLSRH